MRVLVRPTHPAVFDDQHRPITAGGFVDGAPVVSGGAHRLGDVAGLLADAVGDLLADS